MIRDETQSIERGLIAVVVEGGRLICMKLHRSANRVNYQADKTPTTSRQLRFRCNNKKKKKKKEAKRKERKKEGGGEKKRRQMTIPDKSLPRVSTRATRAPIYDGHYRTVRIIILS